MIVRVGPYDPPLRRLALDLKYRGREVNARFLAGLLASRMRKQPWIDEITALVPVPMHPLRRLQRPCDHAGVLGEALAGELKVPLRRWLTRSRYAVSQTQMPSKAKRLENAAGCFELSRAGRLQTGLNGETVCLVDNVIVSGATLHECSKALRRGGVRRIYAAIVTKASMPGDPDPLAAGISAAGQP